MARLVMVWFSWVHVFASKPLFGSQAVEELNWPDLEVDRSVLLDNLLMVVFTG
jgi:hypothetical protein